MRKFLISLFLTFASVCAFADSNFLVKGGAQFSKFSISESSSLLGARGGFGGMIGLGNSSFYFQPQLLYAMKGQASGVVFDKCTLHCVEVPMNIGAMLKFTRHIGLGITVGPYASYAVAGTCSSDANVFDEIERFDLGLTAGVSVHLWRFFVFGDLDYGIRDLGKPDKYSERFTTMAVAAGIGFTF